MCQNCKCKQDGGGGSPSNDRLWVNVVTDAAGNADLLIKKRNAEGTVIFLSQEESRELKQKLNFWVK